MYSISYQLEVTQLPLRGHPKEIFEAMDVPSLVPPPLVQKPFVTSAPFLTNGFSYHDILLLLFQSVPSKCLRQRQYLPRRP